MFFTSEEKAILAVYLNAAGKNAGKEELVLTIREGMTRIDDPRLLGPVKRLLSKVQRMSEEEVVKIDLSGARMMDGEDA